MIDTNSKDALRDRRNNGHKKGLAWLGENLNKVGDSKDKI